MNFSNMVVFLLVSCAALTLAVPYSGGYGKSSIISVGGGGHGNGIGGYPLSWYYPSNGHGSGGHGSSGYGGSYKSYIAIADKYLDNGGQQCKLILIQFDCFNEMIHLF